MADSSDSDESDENRGAGRASGGWRRAEEGQRLGDERRHAGKGRELGDELQGGRGEEDDGRRLGRQRPAGRPVAAADLDRRPRGRLRLAARTGRGYPGNSVAGAAGPLDGAARREAAVDAQGRRQPGAEGQECGQVAQSLGHSVASRRVSSREKTSNLESTRLAPGKREAAAGGGTPSPGAWSLPDRAAGTGDPRGSPERSAASQEPAAGVQRPTWVTRARAGRRRGSPSRPRHRSRPPGRGRPTWVTGARVGGAVGNQRRARRWVLLVSRQRGGCSSRPGSTPSATTRPISVRPVRSGGSRTGSTSPGEPRSGGPSRRSCSRPGIPGGDRSH